MMRHRCCQPRAGQTTPAATARNGAVAGLGPMKEASFRDAGRTGSSGPRQVGRSIASESTRTYRSRPRARPIPGSSGTPDRSRSRPGGPCSPRLIGVPRADRGRPARLYTQLSRSGLVSPVVTWPGRALLRRAAGAQAPPGRAGLRPAGRHGSMPRRNSISARVKGPDVGQGRISTPTGLRDLR